MDKATATLGIGVHEVDGGAGGSGNKPQSGSSLRAGVAFSETLACASSASSSLHGGRRPAVSAVRRHFNRTAVVGPR